MEIELHCQGCGKLIHAPHEAGGGWTQCPACGRSLYVPTPASEREELPLAPEDSDFLRREAALLDERRRLDRIVNREREQPAGGEPRPRSQPEPERSGTSLQSALLDYLRALTRSDLAAAEQVLPVLRHQRTEALAMLDRLAADQMPPAALGNVPAGVYQGFLKHLRSQLAT